LPDSFARSFAASFILLTACSHRDPTLVSPQVAYIRLAVALGERDSDSIDYYYGPESWVADIRRSPPPLDEIARAARQLRATLRNADRLRRQLDAVAARADMLAGASLAFDEESQALFGVRLPATLDQISLDRNRGELARLPQSVEALEKRFLIPPDRIPAVMERAIAGCRAATLSHIQLPQNESITIQYVRNKPWSAYSLYLGNFRSRISINTDFALPIDRALQLACHEGYPGHHVMHMLQDVTLVRGQKRIEWMVQPAFSPQSWASEALASYATDVAFPGATRAVFERDELVPLAGIDPRGVETYEHAMRLLDRLQIVQAAVAREFLDGRLEWARASAALEKDAAMAHTDEALKYISEFRTGVLGYTLGRERVQAVVGSAHPWPRYEQLLTDPDAAVALK
jgi:hypothetical protein